MDFDDDFDDPSGNDKRWRHRTLFVLRWMATALGAGLVLLRIVEMIEADTDISFDDVAAMQLDTHNRHADRLGPWPTDLNLAGEDGIFVRAREILAEWDRNNDANSAGAAIFEAAWRNLLMKTFHDDLEQDL